MQKTYNATIDYTPAYRRLEYIAQPSSGDELKFPYIVIPNYRPAGWKWEIQYDGVPDVTNVQSERSNLMGSIYIKNWGSFKSEYRQIMMQMLQRDGGTFNLKVQDMNPYWREYSLTDLGQTKHTIEINYNLDGKMKLDGYIRTANLQLFEPRYLVDWGVYWQHVFIREIYGPEDRDIQYPTAPGVRLCALHIQLEDGTKIALIPAQRKSDGEIGLYDTYSQTFLTNSNSTSDHLDFVAGPVIDEWWDRKDPDQ